jgi:hypothetical protein
VIKKEVTMENLSLSTEWLRLKQSVASLQELQESDGSVADQKNFPQATELTSQIILDIKSLAPLFPHEENYLEAVINDLNKWIKSDFTVPDFLDSILEFHPAANRLDGLKYLVLFPMYTQNGSKDRHFEVLLVEVKWPDFIVEAESLYNNKLFVPLRFIDYTSGYETNSAVLFPETVAMREVPTFTWGAIFQDREASRFRKVVKEAAEVTSLVLPADALEMIENQQVSENTFILWDLIHDRTHMSGDLPFDPFMIKQRMPYFLYGLEELRCDLTAFRECIKLSRDKNVSEDLQHYAKLVQYAVIFDRIFRFAVTGNRVRNYDGMAGQLMFSWMHQHGVLHWTDNKLSIDWEDVPQVVAELGNAIDRLYWESIDRPKIVHWLEAYKLVTSTLTPHPSSVWAKGLESLPLNGKLSELTDVLLDDEFPLSMFYEAYSKKIAPTINLLK